ncbi:MAG TPA: nicotinate-nucleotide adenylyltransferase [Syntrophomonadaceae bacterium]|nr:nicotinate-nucleotide adenylyltransferase [Syntrophomonadaceae bacterium]
MTVNKVGIIGGTFDPIHCAHLVVAEWAKDELGLDFVIFVPAANPPHKDFDEVLDKSYRFKMVELALRGNEDFVISDFEMQRSGKSYTIDTIKYFKRLYPQTELFFIMGIDSLFYLDTWKDVEELIDLCKLIVATRPGYVMEDNHVFYDKLPQRVWDKTTFIEIPELEISSRVLRQRVRENKSIKYLVPESIEKYIKDNNIYGESDDKKL